VASSAGRKASSRSSATVTSTAVPKWVSVVSSRSSPSPADSRRHWRRVGLVAAAVLLAAAVGGAGVFAAGSGDRDLAADYRRTLAVADGSAFGAWRLGDAGTVFLYQGSPSWMFVSMQPSAGAGPYACELVLRGGRRMSLGTFSLQAYQTGWGRTIPVALDEVAGVQLRDLGRHQTFEARIGRG